MAENFIPNTISTFTNDTTAVNAVNNNFSAIATLLNDVLSRSGVSPNQMGSTLDMNQNQIINLPSPGSINSPARLVDVASNPTITVPPTGTSGATVPFLNGNNTWSNTQTFTSTGVGNAIAVSQTGSGSSSANPFIYSSFSVSDNISNANQIDALSCYMGLNGTGVNSARTAFQSTLQLTAPTSASNPTRFYVAGEFVSQALSNDGGGLGTEKGQLFALSPVVQLGPSATHMAAAVGMELNTLCQTGSSTLIKYGISIVQETGDLVQGSNQDAALFFGNQSGTVGWSNLIQIGDGINANPLTTTGTLLALKGNPTFANGINLSNVTSITGNAYSSPGFSITGLGVLSLGAVGGTTGTINLLGSTSGSSSLTVSPTGANITISQNLTTTGAVTTNNHLITSGSGIATPTPIVLGGTSGSIGFSTPSAIFNPSGTYTLTLPAASSFSGFWFYFKNITANAVNSASSNVVPIGSNTAGIAILAASAGKFVFLQSDGTNWQVMAGN